MLTSAIAPSKPAVSDSAGLSQVLNLAVLGSGAWGSALAQLAEYSGHNIEIWSRRNGRHLGEVVAGADVILSAISMKGVAALAQQLKALQIPERGNFSDGNQRVRS